MQNAYVSYTNLLGPIVIPYSNFTFRSERSSAPLQNVKLDSQWARSGLPAAGQEKTPGTLDDLVVAIFLDDVVDHPPKAFHDGA